MSVTMNKNSRAKDEHCQSMMSKMWDLRSQDQFCDVTIKVDQKVFHCHRIFLCAGSEYFSAMFRGGFSESTATEVTLHEFDANAFETLLLFLYTGNACINASNVCRLIQAADFCGIASLEKHFIEFAKEEYSTLSIEDILRIFITACTTRMKSLCTFLIRYIYGDFGYFSDSPEFINLTWDSLIELAGEAFSANKQVALTDAFVEGTLKWIRGQENASVDEKNSYLDQLSKIINRTKSFTNYVQEMIEKHINEEQSPNKNVVAAFVERPPKLLRAFVKRPFKFWFRSTASSIFTLHEMKAGSAWAYSGEFKLSAGVTKSVVMDDSLYSLIYNCFDEGGASLVRYRRAFTGASHISTSRRQYLRRPPCITDSFEICGVNNSIFAHNQIDPNVGSYTWDRNFTKEELSRGVLLYRRDVDLWFPLPPPLKFNHSCMTCDERMIYLIGGKNSDHRVQGYDLRAPAWIVLAPTTGTYEDAACCNRDGKIWVAGGNTNSTTVEIFDPTAGTWECGKQLIESRHSSSQLINWESVQHGRTVVSFRYPLEADSTFPFADESQPRGWNVIPSLRSALDDSRIARDVYNIGVVDMVAF